MPPADIDHLRLLIESHKSKAASGAPDLDTLYSQLEKGLEDTGRNVAFREALTEHLKEKTTEIRSIRNARNKVLCVGIFMCITALGAFYAVLLLFHWKILAEPHNPAAQVAFISASFVSSFGLIAIILRGLLRHPETSENSGIISESVKVLLDLFHGQNG